MKMVTDLGKAHLAIIDAADNAVMRAKLISIAIAALSALYEESGDVLHYLDAETLYYSTKG